MANTSTLGQLMRAVGKSLKSEVNSYEEAKTYSMVVSFSDDRTQAVAARSETDDRGDEWVLIESSFGSVSDLDPVDLLHRNFSKTGPLFIAVQEEDGSAHVATRVYLDDLDEERLTSTLMSVAMYADELENELVGGDET